MTAPRPEGNLDEAADIQPGSLAAFVATRLDATRKLAQAYLDHAVARKRPGPERWSNSTLLNAVEAMQRILAEHGPANGGRDASRCRVCAAIHDSRATRFRAPCPTLLSLAAVYSDHPDYRQEWDKGFARLHEAECAASSGHVPENPS